MTVIELSEQLDDICHRYPEYWRSDKAQRELQTLQAPCGRRRLRAGLCPALATPACKSMTLDLITRNTPVSGSPACDVRRDAKSWLLR